MTHTNLKKILSLTLATAIVIGSSLTANEPAKTITIKITNNADITLSSDKTVKDLTDALTKASLNISKDEHHVLRTKGTHSLSSKINALKETTLLTEVIAQSKDKDVTVELVDALEVATDLSTKLKTAVNDLAQAADKKTKTEEDNFKSAQDNLKSAQDKLKATNTQTPQDEKANLEKAVKNAEQTLNNANSALNTAKQAILTELFAKTFALDNALKDAQALSAYVTAVNDPKKTDSLKKTLDNKETQNFETAKKTVADQLKGLSFDTQTTVMTSCIPANVKGKETIDIKAALEQMEKNGDLTSLRSLAFIGQVASPEYFAQNKNLKEACEGANPILAKLSPPVNGSRFSPTQVVLGIGGSLVVIGAGAAVAAYKFSPSFRAKVQKLLISWNLMKPAVEQEMVTAEPVA